MRKHSHPCLRRWALVALLLASAVGATVPFTLRFGASGSLDIDIDPPVEPDLTAFQLGFRVDALDGVDGFDMPFPSITPPDGGVILYFPADAPYSGLAQDFRPPAASAAWQMELVGMVAGSSAVLSWRLQDGSLDGNALSLVDRLSGAVLVGDMTTTRSYGFADTDRSLLVLYSSANHPPVARSDVAAMLQSAGSLEIPFDDLLANDYDPDAGNAIEVVSVGDPFVQSGSGKGVSVYGTTSIPPAPGPRRITYTLPPTLPDDWDGLVYFPYTIRDDSTDAAAPHEGSATVAVTVAPKVLTVPTPAQLAAHPGQSVTVSYTLLYSGSLHSLALSFTLPITGPGPIPEFWPYGSGSYTDDAATAPPTISSGAGDDGVWGSTDDTGVLVLDFGLNVPPSGTAFSFALSTPTGAMDSHLPSLASYKVSGLEPDPLEQPLPDVAIVAAYTITFASAANGTILGTASQLLEPGRLSSEITAVPDPGYHFLRWTQAGVEISRINPLRLTGGATDLTITAEFEANTYTITFVVAVAGTGTLTGLTSQSVPYLGSAAPVTAVPAMDYYFDQWRDGNTDNPRTISGVTADATYTAEFLPLTPGDPSGHFDLFFQNQTTGSALRSVWDLTGSYETSLNGPVMSLNLVHHEDGTLTGLGQLQGTVGAQAFLVSNLQIRGSSTGRNGSLTVRGGLTGANAATSVSLKLALARVGQTLTGVVTGSVTDALGGRLAINAPCVLNLPAAMDGGYRLPTDLILGARGTLTGTSTLTLAGGRTVALLVYGKRQGSLAILEYRGNPAADPAFAPVSFKLTVRTYASGVAGVRVLSGKAFGQSFSWHL